MLRPHLALILLATIAGSVQAADRCTLQPVALAQSQAEVDGLWIAIDGADDAQPPTSWIGPITLQAPGQAPCATADEVGVIDAPLALDRKQQLWVPTHSGSMNRLFIVDPATCRVVWRGRPVAQAITLLPDGVLIGRRKVSLDPTCRPHGLASAPPAPD